MKIEWASGTYGSIAIEKLFVSEYMKELSGDAVKLYVYLVYSADEGLGVSAIGVLENTLLSEDRYKSAICELINAGLIETQNGNIVMLDLGNEYAMRKYGIGGASKPGEVFDASEPIDRDFEEAVKVINASYFSGKMSSSWYSYITSTLKKRFDAEVIVMLFDHCSRLVTRLNIEYVKKVADSWTAEQIRTVADLQKYLEVDERRKKFIAHVKKGFARPLIPGEKTMVIKWLEEYGYDEDVVDILLNSTSFMKPTFTNFDLQMKKWHDAGLADAEAIKVYEAALAEERQSKRDEKKKASQDSKEDKKPKTRGNFDEREYKDDFYEKLLEDKINE